MRRIALLLATLTCTACVTADRLDGPPGASAAATPAGFDRPVRTDGMDRRFFEANAQASIARVAAAATDGSIDVLALSGGGAGGAFGAGVLVGLSDAHTRPQYEIVTGVSTGALIAPLAFLGPDYDDELTEAYAHGASQDLMHPFGAGALFHTAIFNGKPLRDLVNQFVDDALVQAVAAESRNGRLLLVATTNLDREEMVIWNMGAIAEQGGPHALALFRDVLVASASVPGVFPPVLIRVEDNGRSFQEMHVDGGASIPFFIAPDIAIALGEAPEQLHGANVFVISNSQLGGPSHTTPFNTISIASRSFTAVMNHMTRAAIAQTDAFAARNQMRFRFTSIPRDYQYGGSLAFDQKAMSALFDYGRRCAAAGAIWVDTQQALARVAMSEGRAPSADAPCPTPAS
ncbi:MAG TPA: patatin-like phospholipase family protein [Caulobacterales bacterium]|nr:patatin-like phospholipase family protein [Caulobacterales bacterium]